jgi:capsular polysaccharide biosynthesis protein
VLTKFDKECISRYEEEIKELRLENIRLSKQVVKNYEEIQKRERWIKEILDVGGEEFAS